MISEQMDRLGIGIRDPGDLAPIYDDAQNGTERAIHHYLRDGKTTPALRELATKLLIDFVVDASKLGAGKREMLFGIYRFEHTNAPGNAFSQKIPPTWRRFGASVFCDENDGAVYAFIDGRPRLDDAQIASIMGKDRVRDFKAAEDFLAFHDAAATKIADSLETFLAACEPCDDTSPGDSDYPKYE